MSSDELLDCTDEVPEENLDDSEKDTRKKLESALARLRKGNPRNVPEGTPINAKSVCKEAGINRTTLYRYHQPIVDQIKGINNRTHKQQLNDKHSELKNLREKLAEYTEMLNEAQEEIKKWGNNNYKLSSRVDELEALVVTKDSDIRKLQSLLSSKDLEISELKKQIKSMAGIRPMG